MAIDRETGIAMRYASPSYKNNSRQVRRLSAMLRRMKDLKGFAIGAKDGDVGEANDFISDDKNWTVRYRSPVVRAKRENRTKIRIVEG